MNPSPETSTTQRSPRICFGTSCQNTKPRSWSDSKEQIRLFPEKLNWKLQFSAQCRYTLQIGSFYSLFWIPRTSQNPLLAIFNVDTPASYVFRIFWMNLDLTIFSFAIGPARSHLIVLPFATSIVVHLIPCHTWKWDSAVWIVCPLSEFGFFLRHSRDIKSS